MLVLAASTAFAPGGGAGRAAALSRPRNSFASPLMLSNWLNSDATPTLSRDEADGVVLPGPTAKTMAWAIDERP